MIKISKYLALITIMLCTLTASADKKKDKGICSCTCDACLSACLHLKYDSVSKAKSYGYTVEKNNKWGVVNSQGIEIVPCKYDKIVPSSDGNFFIVKKKDKYGYLSNFGKEIVSCIYDNAQEFKGGFAFVSKKGKWGIINILGNEIIKCKYDEIAFLSHYLIKVKLGSKYGLFYKSGEIAYPCKYDKISEVQKDGYITMSMDKSWGLINSKGELPIPIIFKYESLLRGCWRIEQDHESRLFLIIDSNTIKEIFRVPGKEDDITISNYSINLINNEYYLCTKKRRYRFDNYYIYDNNGRAFYKYRDVDLKNEIVDKDMLIPTAHMPYFPGGDAALNRIVNYNLHYPESASNNNIEGKVIVQFLVTKTGEIGDVKVTRSVNKDLDREAVRVCKLLPRFIPGRNANGDPVNVWYTLPFTFKLTKK